MSDVSRELLEEENRRLREENEILRHHYNEVGKHLAELRESFVALGFDIPEVKLLDEVSRR